MQRPHVKELMVRAFERHVLVPSFNIAYLPMMAPVVVTLDRLNAFGLVEVARPDVEKFGAGSFADVAGVHQLEDPEAQTGLHLDHVPVVDEDGERVDWESLIREGLDLGFESVMIDGSRLSLEENIAVTRRVVEMAGGTSAVEAELGAVLGHEAGPLPPYEELFASRRGFTDPDEARRFVRETGVDWLSVAVGNIHGAISGAAKDKAKVEARLHIEHLARLAEVTGVPLVLHGGSGIQPECLREAAEHGIAKINVGTDIRQAYERTLADTGDVIAAQAAVAERVELLMTDTYRMAGSRDRLMGE